MVASTIPAYAVAFAALMTLAGCSGDRNVKSVTFDPNIGVFSDRQDGVGFSGRVLTCTKEIDGQCMQKECKQGEGGPSFDCASYAAACVGAGEHWSGTKEGGTCTRVL
ncbi:MAG: hypothetical protein AB7F41_05010 [Methylocystis sp.]|uniref:hypothetical protein n=1 Tax=Methylocystis sp. TaxID=1911079 RepID=UPI003D0FA859